MKITALLISGVLLTSGVSAQVVDGTVSRQEKSGDWDSFVIQLGGRTKIRMSSVNVTSTSSELIVLVLQTSPPCDRMDMEFIVKLNKTPERKSTVNLLATMRVDNKPPKFGRVIYNATAGDTYGLFVLEPMAEFPSLAKEMSGGQVLRIRMDEVNGETLSNFSYSLTGFTGALNRLMNLCQQVAAKQSPPTAPKYEELRPRSTQPSLPAHPEAPRKSQPPILPAHPDVGT